MDMQDLLNKYERALYQVSDEELDRILTAHDIWFAIWEDDCEERQQTITRKEKIDWIINTDPICVEGGLMDFMSKIIYLGLIDLSETEKSKKVMCPKCFRQINM